MDKVKFVKQVEKYSLIIGFICIFAAAFLPALEYISTAAFAITYITALIRQYQKLGKIKPVTFMLCTASFTWIIVRQFTDSIYIGLFGQLIIYAYLINTQYQLLGKIKKSFLLFLAIAITINVWNTFYPNKVAGFVGIAMQLWIIFKFLDPILEDIALKHRAKRLAEEAKEKESNTVEGTILEESDSKEKVEAVWEAETVQVSLHG